MTARHHGKGGKGSVEEDVQAGLKRRRAARKKAEKPVDTDPFRQMDGAESTYFKKA
ncbi:MAG: hypothetical protein JW951_04690 [Lentisphaerae bacterium]|nr:hypothetical protein [Lentisphaerota bacterium]